MKNGNYQRAIDVYEQISKEYPNSSISYYLKTKTYFAQKKYAEALDNINIAIGLDSTFSDYFVSRGNIEQILLNHDNAVDDFRKAIFMDKNPYGYTGIGDILIDSFRYKEARYFYNEAFRIKQDAIISSKIAHSYFLQNNFDSAVIFYSVAIKLDPENSIIYYNRAFAKYNQGDKSGGISDLTKSIDLDSLNDMSYYIRSVIYQYLGDSINAQKDLNKAVTLGNCYAIEDIKMQK